MRLATMNTLTRVLLLLLGAGTCSNLIRFTLTADTLKLLDSFCDERMRESLLWRQSVLNLPLNAFLQK
jgi:hypothetical protein